MWQIDINGAAANSVTAGHASVRRWAELWQRAFAIDEIPLGAAFEVVAGMIGQLTARLALGRLCRLAAICGALAVSASLGGCGSFSAAVSDHWPHWAGGMPDGVPPRPGAAGYDEFISHQAAKQAAVSASDAQKSGSPSLAGASTQAAQTVSANGGYPASTTAPAAAPQLIPASAMPNGQAAGPGGLY